MSWGTRISRGVLTAASSARMTGTTRSPSLYTGMTTERSRATSACGRRRPGGSRPLSDVQLDAHPDRRHGTRETDRDDHEDVEDERDGERGLGRGADREPARDGTELVRAEIAGRGRERSTESRAGADRDCRREWELDPERAADEPDQGGVAGPGNGAEGDGAEHHVDRQPRDRVEELADEPHDRRRNKRRQTAHNDCPVSRNADEDDETSHHPDDDETGADHARADDQRRDGHERDEVERPLDQHARDGGAEHDVEAASGDRRPGDLTETAGQDRVHEIADEERT